VGECSTYLFPIVNKTNTMSGQTDQMSTMLSQFCNYDFVKISYFTDPSLAHSNDFCMCGMKSK
jgi:hypothetical protein